MKEEMNEKEEEGCASHSKHRFPVPSFFARPMA